MLLIGTGEPPETPGHLWSSGKRRASSEGCVTEKPWYHTVPLSNGESLSFLHLIPLSTPGAVVEAVKVLTKAQPHYTILSSAAPGRQSSPLQPQKEGNWNNSHFCYAD